MASSLIGGCGSWRSAARFSRWSLSCCCVVLADASSATPLRRKPHNRAADVDGCATYSGIAVISHIDAPAPARLCSLPAWSGRMAQSSVDRTRLCTMRRVRGGKVDANHPRSDNSCPNPSTERHNLPCRHPTHDVILRAHPAGEDVVLRRGYRAAEAVIGELAAGQHGVVTRAQLERAGVSRHVIDRRVKLGLLRTVHAGIYQVGVIGAPHGREMAALLACGGGVISHRTAAVLWEMLPAQPANVIDVTLPERCHPRRREGIRAHRQCVMKDEAAVVDG